VYLSNPVQRLQMRSSAKLSCNITYEAPVRVFVCIHTYM
jgi:hypothetical protein